MSVMLDRLRRFRPVGAPGGAGPVGVPVDRRSDAPTELVAVFDALDAVITECRQIRAQAEQEAAELINAAQREAGGLVASAAARGAAERAEAAAAITARGDAVAERTRTTATAEAELLTRRGRQRIDEVVALILDRVRADAGRAGAA
jgi:vacuolar-type H+-ATPase subunit H